MARTGLTIPAMLARIFGIRLEDRGVRRLEIFATWRLDVDERRVHVARRATVVAGGGVAILAGAVDEGI